MKALLISVSLLSLGILPTPANGATDDAPYVVVLERSVPSVNDATARLERSQGFQSRFRYGRALKGFAARLDQTQLQRVRRDPAVAHVVPDRPVHATAQLTPGDSVPTGVQRMEAGSAAGVNVASNVGVAVLDTGIQLSHPDLNALNGTNCINPSASANDDNGHGTHVAGTVAARNNGLGVVGVAPDTPVYAVKVLNSSGNGSLSTILCGINWVTANAPALNIGVANMSLRSNGWDDGDCGGSSGDPQHAAICASTSGGVAYVVAAGNDNEDLASSTPAAYPEVLTVTAVTDSDGAPGGAGPAPACRPAEGDEFPASFSNFATSDSDAGHTLAAPGVCIVSTWLGGGQATASGTSMASPHVAGAVALCIGSGGAPGPCAGMDTEQIVTKLRTQAALRASVVGPDYGFQGDPFRPVEPLYYGHLATATPPAPPSATTGDTVGVSANAATLRGVVTPNWLPGRLRFEYGTSAGYGSLTAEQTVAGSGGQEVSSALTGLSPGTTYHYRLVVSTGAGTARGADRTFRTAPAPSSTGRVVARLFTRRSARLTRGMRLRTGIVVQCPPGRATCRGRASLTSGRRLGRLSFAVPPGTAREVVVRLNRSGRRLLNRRKRLRVRIVVRLSRPSVKTLSRTARIARPRR